MACEESKQQPSSDAVSVAWNSGAQLERGLRVDAGEYARRRIARNTERAYRSDWADFTAWCAAHNVQAAPASESTVAAYIANLATPNEEGGRGRRASTVRRRLASISEAHERAGLESHTRDPLVRRVMAGIVHEHGSAPGRKNPIRLHHLKLIVRQIPASPAGIRDKALLLFGFAGGFRRSELVAIDRSHLDFVHREGVEVVVHSHRYATEQIIGIPYGRHPETCPVRALLTWLELLPDDHGPVFRPFDRWGHIRQSRLTDEWVATVVKRYVQSIGMDPKQFGGHSLRVGLAMSADAAGASERSIMNQTRHRSSNMVRQYIRSADIPPGTNALRFTGL